MAMSATPVQKKKKLRMKRMYLNMLSQQLSILAEW